MITQARLAGKSPRKRGARNQDDTGPAFGNWPVESWDLPNTGPIMPTMIARLSGTLSVKQANRVVIDVQGVGYEVVIPLSTYYELGAEGEVASLLIHTHVREDAFQLFGFRTANEKALFTELIQISGIGPRLAVTILSGLPAEELTEAVIRGNLARLVSIPGVGKKTAERILLELKSKAAKLLPEAASTPAGARSALHEDVVSALVNLGYARNVAEKAVDRAARERQDGGFEALLKLALRKTGGGA